MECSYCTMSFWNAGGSCGKNFEKILFFFLTGGQRRGRMPIVVGMFWHVHFSGDPHEKKFVSLLVRPSRHRLGNGFGVVRLRHQCDQRRLRPVRRQRGKSKQSLQNNLSDLFAGYCGLWFKNRVVGSKWEFSVRPTKIGFYVHGNKLLCSLLYVTRLYSIGAR